MIPAARLLRSFASWIAGAYWPPTLSFAQLRPFTLWAWGEIFFTHRPEIGAQVAACCVGPHAKIEDVARCHRAEKLAAIRGLRSRVHFRERRDCEVEKSREVAGIVAIESFGDIRRRVEGGVIELIAKI